MNGFFINGIKTVTSDTYTLLSDKSGQIYIQHVPVVAEDIKYAKMPTDTDAATFWADPTIHTFKFFFEL